MLYDERRNWELFWLVDPLDGTVEFIKGNNEFTVNIALMADRVCTCAVVYVPYLQKAYVASREVGSFLIDGIAWCVALVGGDTEFVGALPTALMKPLSGSGARGLMVDAMTTYGADSFVGRLACLFQGATDTTFYILAVYFGSVGIRKTRHAVTCGLLADLAGIVSAIFICYLFFG